MAVRVIGAHEISQAIREIIRRLDDIEIVTRLLSIDLRRFAHVDTGYMKSTVYYRGNIAGAYAYYAGHEADRGGEHDFGQLAIDAFPIEEYADYIVEPY